MVYIHAKLHKASCNGSLLIVIKPEAEEHFLTADMFLCYVLHTCISMKVACFFKACYSYFSSYPEVSVASIAAVLQVSSFVMLLLLIVRN